MKRRTFQLETAEQGLQLDAVLAGKLAWSLFEAHALIVAGAVYVDGRRCVDPARRLACARALTAVLEEAGQSTLLPGIVFAPVVLFEDDHLIAVNKPAGMPAQPTAGRTGSNLSDWIGERLRGFSGLVHRLDRETSGVTVFGKDAVTTRALAAQ